MPDLAARAGIERVDFVGTGHVHDSINDDRSVFNRCDVRNRKHPARRKARDVVFVDLRHRRVAITAWIAVVGGPVLLRCDGAIAVGGRFAEKVDALIVGQKLEIGHAFVEHAAVEHLAIGGLNFFTDDSRRGRRRLCQHGARRRNKKQRENECAHSRCNISYCEFRGPAEASPRGRDLSMAFV